MYMYLAAAYPVVSGFANSPHTRLQVHCKVRKPLCLVYLVWNQLCAAVFATTLATWYDTEIIKQKTIRAY